MKPAHLAVYGLLIPGQGAFEAFGLDRALAPAGACRIRGRLFNLGGYPGLVPGAGTVHGQLFRIQDPACLKRLDAYENYDPADPRGSEYLRRPLKLIEPEVMAWVYVYNRTPPLGRRIADGRWQPDLMANDSRLRAANSHRAGF